MTRFGIQAIAVVAALGCWLQAAVAQPPAYRKLDATTETPRKLQAEPLLWSRFPTTFSVAVLPDGTKLRTVDIDGRVWQRSAKPESEVQLVTELDCEPACAVISADARLLAFADAEGAVTVLDLDTKQVRWRDETATQRTVALAFSPDARRLAAVTVGGQVRVWYRGGGKPTDQFTVEASPVQTLAFAPDGRRLAVASYISAVRIYQLPHQGDAPATNARETASPALRASAAKPSAPPADASKPIVIHAGGSRVTACAFTPNGEQLVIATADGAAKVHDLSGEREPVPLGAHPFAIWSIVFEPGGTRMAAGSWDGTIQLWDAASWQPLQSIKKHEESVASMAFVREGLCSAGLDGRLFYWLPEVDSISRSGVIAGRDDSVWVATHSPDGKRLFVGGRGQRFELWDAEKHQLIVSRAGHPTTRCAVFSPDGKTLATGGDDGTIALCDADSGKTRTTLQRHRGSVSAVLFAEEGRSIISVCDGGEVKVWNVGKGAEQATWREHRQQVYCAALSPDETWLITGGGNWTTGDPGELLVWRRATGQVHARLAGHRLAVWSVLFLPDGKRFVASDSSGAVKVWNLETLQEERTLQHAAWVRPLALSRDGQTLAVGRGDGSIRLWDTLSWTERASCDGNKGFFFWLEFSPDGKNLVSGGVDGTVGFWQPELLGDIE
ncbi:MAG TPA: WD40 repeat domain-containing protein [Pirellulales bacterium]|nr:WD40 repeat domain-containing protein [Pirellulales bacterium]